MTQSNIQALKVDLIHWLTELHDINVLQNLADLKKNQLSSFELNEEQKAELDNRLEKYSNGQMKFSSCSEVKDRIRSSAKNV